MARLLVAFQGAEFAFELRGESVRVGSGTACGLVLRDPAVGKEHLEIRRAGPAWRLVDLESATGTRVNGLYVNRQDLKDGDVVAVGPARLTFVGEDGPSPAPIAGYAAPAPIPSAPPAPAPSAWAPPPAAPPARRGAPARDEGRDRDRERRPRYARAPGGGGGWILAVLFLVLGGGAVAAVVLSGPGKRGVDPNLAWIQRAELLESQGNFEELAKLEGQGDRTRSDTWRQIQWAAERGKKGLERARAEAAAKEPDEFLATRIRGPRDARLDEPVATALACDEFLRRWPDHPKAADVHFIRLASAAEAEAARRMEEGRYAEGHRIYENFLRKGETAVLPEYRASFREGMEKKKIYLLRKAKDLFEAVEDRAMLLEDRRQYEEEERLYREARENLGIGEIVTRCDAEIARLKDLRGR
jgi:hypothetical protein